MKNVSLAALSSALDEKNLLQAKEVQIQMIDEFIQCGLDNTVFHLINSTNIFKNFKTTSTIEMSHYFFL